VVPLKNSHNQIALSVFISERKSYTGCNGVVNTEKSRYLVIFMSTEIVF
jgi:hypothetical protein